MTTKAEILNAVLRGLGRRPTFFLLRWSPSWKNPLKFDLLEVAKCSVDGGIVTNKSAQSPRGDHLGHQIKSPKYYSLWELLMVQLRVIK